MDDPERSAPLYRRIAARLQAAIQDGDYRPGSVLPTEIELADQLGVSRHTVRDALRLLANAGIVRRRRRIGTEVIGDAPAATFIQPLRGYDDLLQYARKASLILDGYGPADRAPLVRRYGLNPAFWLRIEGRRAPAHRPVGLLSTLVRRDCAPSRATVERDTAALFDIIERQTGVETTRIDQEIAACALTRRAAAALLADPGSPALRTVRRYYDQVGQVFLISETTHPGDRFSYAMTYTRQAARARLAA